MTAPATTMFGSPATNLGVPLRPHQVTARERVFDALDRGVTRQLLAMATGTGKTLAAAAIAGKFRSVLFLVHRQELLEQTIDTFAKAHPGEPMGVIWGRNTDHHARFSVGMVQTVHNRLDKIPSDAFDMVIPDECHRYGSRTFKAVLEHFRPRLRLGLSATPERYDGAPLSNLFDEVTFEYNVRDAVLDGMLVPPVGVWIRTDTDLDEVHTVAGDLNQGELAATVDTPGRNHLVVDKYLEHASGRRAVVFCVSIAHAQNVARAFQDAGIKADWVSGDDADRREKMQALRDGRLTVLANALLMVEGFDEPSISAILMARPTKSKVLYTQAVGRGLRLHPGKSDVVILDFADTSKRHRLVNMWDFIGRRMAREGAGRRVELVTRDPLAQKIGPAGSDAAASLFRDLFDESMRLDAFAELVDLLEPPPSTPAFSYGRREWHYAPPTPAQLKTLAKFGYDVDTEDFTRGQASAMLSRVPAAPGALRQLFLYGFDTLTQEWTVEQANAALKAAARKGLRPDWARVHALANGGAA